jgi:hypothetical protein
MSELLTPTNERRETYAVVLREIQWMGVGADMRSQGEEVGRYRVKDP